MSFTVTVRNHETHDECTYTGLSLMRLDDVIEVSHESGYDVVSIEEMT